MSDRLKAIDEMMDELQRKYGQQVEYITIDDDAKLAFFNQACYRKDPRFAHHSRLPLELGQTISIRHNPPFGGWPE